MTCIEPGLLRGRKHNTPLSNPHQKSTLPLECKPRTRFLPAQATSFLSFFVIATKIVFSEQILFANQQFIKITSNLDIDIYLGISIPLPTTYKAYPF